MRTTSNIEFYCRGSKMNKKGLSPVEMSINLNGDRRFINLPLKFNPTEFNRPRPPKDIVDALDEWRQTATRTMTQMLQNGIPLTADNLRYYIQTGGVKSYSIDNLFNDFLEILEKRVGNDLSSGVFRKYQLVRNLFMESIPLNGTQEVTAITNAHIRGFYALLNSKYDASTSAGYMTKLKAFIQFGIDNDRIKVNPFQGIKIVKPKKEITYLTEAEVNTIINADLRGNTSLERVRDAFILMCGSGLAYADLKGLKKSDIQEKDGVYYICGRRVKNNQPYTSVILPFAVDVLNKYEVIPVISNQKTNEYLKAIEDIIGFHKHLHCHLARHTYATLLINKKVNTKTISKCLGHSNSKITETFYAELLNDTIIEEVASVF